MHKQEPAEVVVRAIEKIHVGEIWLDRNSLGHVVHTLARGQKADPDAVKIETLTPRERRIIATILRQRGARNKVIAEKLHISEHTLRNNLTSIYSKLEVNVVSNSICTRAPVACRYFSSDLENRPTERALVGGHRAVRKVLNRGCH